MSLLTLPEEELETIIRGFLVQYVQAKMGGTGCRARACNISLTVSLGPRLLSFFAEVGAGAFKPVDFEAAIGADGVPPLVLSPGRRFREVEGKVDRVDLYQADGVAYLRVVDYKTGKRSSSFPICCMA
ncbi:MAG: PD-(D/E)XK nuclease family protein [[Clostridium] leptum]